MDFTKRKKGLCFYKKRVKVSAEATKEIGNYILGIALAIGLAFCLIYSFGMKTSMIGVSMEGTLYNGETVYINRIAYLVFSPKAGDVVVFLPNGNQNTHYYVKRVVGVPGDTVEFREGTLYINGEPRQDESYDKVADPGIAETPIQLGDDEYFVLGDNRNNSEDSRSSNIGLVKKELITGKAWLRCGNGDIGFIK